MTTEYLTRAALEQLLGAPTVVNALAASDADLAAVIAAQSAIADGYVARQTPLPLHASAIAQVAPVVAELVYCALYAQDASDTTAKRRSEAMKTLRDIAEGTLTLFTPPVADDPATAEDESYSGAAFGSAPRMTSLPSSGGADAAW